MLNNSMYRIHCFKSNNVAIFNENFHGKFENISAILRHLMTDSLKTDYSLKTNKLKAVRHAGGCIITRKIRLSDLIIINIFFNQCT